MRYLLIILVAVCALACNRRVIQTKSLVTEVRDSIVHDTTTVTRDSLITVPGSVVVLKDTIPCPELTLFRQEKKGHVTATLKITKGVIDVKCEADSLQLLVQMLKRQLIREVNFHREKVVSTDTKVIEKRYTLWVVLAGIVGILLGWFLSEKLNR